MENPQRSGDADYQRQIKALARGLRTLRDDREHSATNRRGAEAVNDPELCIYDPLDPVLQNEIREHFLYRFNQDIDRKFQGAYTRPLGIDSMTVEGLVSRERNDDGHRWLKLLTTDGSTWYCGWEGDRAAAVHFADGFGETTARDF